MSETKMTIGKNGALTFEDISQSLSKITEQHKAIGRIETPKGLIKKRQGFDYVELSYMKNMANEQFPGWSWTIISSEALGSNAYVVHGRLKWIDNGLWREGDMVAAHRIQTKRGTSEFVDIGNDIKSANTDCMKKALNVYMDIAADVYRSEDPSLDDDQIEKIFSLAEKVDKQTVEMIDSIAKLERIAK